MALKYFDFGYGLDLDAPKILDSTRVELEAFHPNQHDHVDRYHPHLQAFLEGFVLKITDISIA